VINEKNRDNYPLMSSVNIFDAGVWEWIPYSLFVLSNSTVSDFSFIPESALIQFDVEDENGTTGFCRVMVPKGLLSTEDNWAVLIDNNPVIPSVDEDEKSTYFYFTYNHSSKTVEIIGTDAIPEFSSWFVLPLAIAVLLVAVVYRNRLALFDH